MASTINAKNTTSGLILSSDTSGQLELQTLDTTRMTITSSGNATFSGSLTATSLSGDGSGLTNVSSMTLLGTLTTTSGTTQTLSGLTLTGYKQIQIFIEGVSHNSGTQQSLRLLDANGSTQLSLNPIAGLGAFVRGIVIIDLNTGVLAGLTESGSSTAPYTTVGVSTVAGETTFSTSATSITFSPSGGSFDAGSILIYGVK